MKARTSEGKTLSTELCRDEHPTVRPGTERSQRLVAPGHKATHSAVGLQDRWLVETEEEGPDSACTTTRNLKTKRICLGLHTISIINGDPIVALQLLFLLQNVSLLSRNSRLEALMNDPDYRNECEELFALQFLGISL